MKDSYLVVINTLRHAMIIHAETNENLFDSIDEFASPYSCLIRKFDDLSICFSTDVTLDAMNGDQLIGDLIGLSDTVPPEGGDYLYNALHECMKDVSELRKGNPNYDTEWMTFNDNNTDLIPFTRHQGFVMELTRNIANLPLRDYPGGRTTIELAIDDPDKMPSIFEKAMTMLLENPQGITHYDVGCNSYDLGAFMFAIQNGYLEQVVKDASEEKKH